MGKVCWSWGVSPENGLCLFLFGGWGRLLILANESWACAFHFSGVLKVDLRRHETMQWLNQSGIPSCVVFPECAIRYKSLVAKLLCIALNGWPLVVSMFDVILLMLCFFNSELQSNTIHPTKWNSIHMALWQYWRCNLSNDANFSRCKELTDERRARLLRDLVSSGRLPFGQWLGSNKLYNWGVGLGRQKHVWNHLEVGLL